MVLPESTLKLARCFEEGAGSFNPRNDGPLITGASSEIGTLEREAAGEVVEATAGAVTTGEEAL